MLKRLSRPSRYGKVRAEIVAIFNRHDGKYGHRRVKLDLEKLDYRISNKKVLSRMREEGLFCKVRMKKYQSHRGEVGRVAPNLLERDFKAEAPNQKWVTDVTEFSLFGEKLYLSPILDLYNSEIVSYSITDRPVFAQVTEMLEKAFVKIPYGTGLIFHSDQGWQYQMRQYQHYLNEKGIRQSMSRKGNCLDNSVMENFFGILKSELLYLYKFPSMASFRQALEDYLDYYNNIRIKAKLKGLSPVQYRTQSLGAA
jgi:putative transposase